MKRQHCNAMVPGKTGHHVRQISLHVLLAIKPDLFAAVKYGGAPKMQYFMGNWVGFSV